jgi:DNA-binding LytR/AlgR family response regulator
MKTISLVVLFCLFVPAKGVRAERSKSVFVSSTEGFSASTCAADAVADQQLLQDHLAHSSAFTKPHNFPREPKSTLEKMPFTEVLKKEAKMRYCAIKDSKNDKDYVYETEANLYAAELSLRLQNFVRRHDLESQFAQEDAANKR